jgi:hypothetical protein
MLGMLLLAAFASCGCSPKEPKIHVDQTEIDGGVLALGESKEIQIPIVNRGNANLLIDAIKTSCSCSSQTLSTKQVRPGKSSLLSFHLIGSQAVGTSNQSLAIVSNDPEQHSLVIKIRMNHRTPVVLSPRFIDLGEIQRGGSICRSVLITVDKDVDFDIGRIQLPQEVKISAHPFRANVKEQLQGTTAEQQIYKTELRFDTAGLPLGDYSKNMWIDMKSHAGLSIRARIIGDIRVSPLSFYYGVLAPGDDPERKVTLASPHNKPFRVLSVETGGLPVDVRVEAKSCPGGAEYELVSRLREGFISGGKKTVLTGIVKVRTDLASQTELEIPLFALSMPDERTRP